MTTNVAPTLTYAAETERSELNVNKYIKFDFLLVCLGKVILLWSVELLKSLAR